MGTPLTRARRGAVLALLAALLLANPLYVGLFVDEPESRSPTGYTAVAIDPGNAADQRTVVQAVGGDEVLQVDGLAEANEYSPYGDRYRAPGDAAAVLRRARSDGSARTADADAAFTLRRVLANHRFVAATGGDARRYYRANLAETGNGVRVTLSPVNRSTVARSVLHGDATLYTSLPRYQRETVDAVLAADESGYRPYNDEFDELTDDVLVKGDTYYVFRAGIHVDDFGPTGRDLLSFGLYALGVLFALVAVVLAALSYRDGPGTDGRDRPTRRR